MSRLTRRLMWFNTLYGLPFIAFCAYAYYSVQDHNIGE